MNAHSVRRGLTPDLRALRHRNFRLYFWGQMTSLVGTWMQSVAQGWLMHRLTAAPFMLGLLSFAQFLPVLPLALHAGVIADHVDKRRLLLVTQSLMLLQATLLALVVSAGVVQAWMVIALAFFYGCINAFDLPGRQSFVIEMVGRDDLANGIALNSAAFNTARIFGPAVAGGLLVVIGEAGCFWVNAVSFLAVIWGLAAMRTEPPPPRARAATSLADGVRYAWSSSSIRSLLVLLALCAGIGFQYSVLLPVYAKDVLHAGPGVYGALLAAFGVGSLVAAVRMTRVQQRWGLRRNLLVGLIAGGLGLVGFAWIHQLAAMLVCGALSGFGLILYVSSTNTLIQMTTEDHYRGRVMSLYTLMFIGTTPFGALLAGGVAQSLGAPVATSLCALFLLGGALYVSVRLRSVAAREAAAARSGADPEPMG